MSFVLPAIPSCQSFFPSFFRYVFSSICSVVIAPFCHSLLLSFIPSVIPSSCHSSISSFPPSVHPQRTTGARMGRTEIVCSVVIPPFCLSLLLSFFPSVIPFFSPSTAYSWYKDGENGNELLDPLQDERYTFINGRLVIDSPSPELQDEGRYQCAASNVYGTILSNQVQLAFGCE